MSKLKKYSKKKPGRKSKLSIEDQILMTLAYLREYRPFFHLAIDWGINQSNVCRIV
ncbi:MAG: transposase family protein, partial [Dolichospermum sp.]